MPTAFQQEVWAAIAKIPRGKVTTYAAIAQQIGRPQAVRAVGTAVGKNPNAPEVPCHRVVRSDGTIGEYSGLGGRAAKIQLLQQEGVHVQSGVVEL